MKTIRTNRLLRLAFVAIALLGYLVLSNHCALAQLAPAAEPVEQERAGCCHRDPSPQQQQQPCPTRDNGIPCCKSLHIVMPDAVKAADTPVQFVAFPLLLGVFAFDSTILENGTPPEIVPGPPPGAATFSDLVLHRSLRSHAPPFLS